MYFIPSTGGFYSADLLGPNVPEGAIEIPYSTFQTCMAAQVTGARIVTGPDNLPNIAVPDPPTTMELLAQKVEEVRFALQRAIDLKAAEFGFPSGGNALMIYAGFPNANQALAQAFGEWEANVWSLSREYEASVIAGTAPMLTAEQAVALMPSLGL